MLWITYGECIDAPEAVVRSIASFLGLGCTDETVSKIVAAIEFSNMKKQFDNHPKLRSGASQQLHFYTAEQLQSFEQHAFQPASAHGMRLGSATNGEARSQLTTDGSPRLSEVGMRI